MRPDTSQGLDARGNTPGSQRAAASLADAAADVALMKRASRLVRGRDGLAGELAVANREIALLKRVNAGLRSELDTEDEASGQYVTRARKHDRAVRQSLGLACEAAGVGQFGDALAWLRTVEIVDGPLAAEWADRRNRWQRQNGTADGDGVSPSPSDETASPDGREGRS